VRSFRINLAVLNASNKLLRLFKLFRFERVVNVS